MGWKDIKTAPKDGHTIIIRTVHGLNKKEIFYECPANWRSEKKPAYYDPITGRCFITAGILTGWMYLDRPYLIPGIKMSWKEEINAGLNKQA